MKSLFILLLLATISFCCSKDDPEISPPTITGYSRTLSVPGKEVAIYGANFSTVPEENIVTFSGNITASVSGSTPSEVRAIVPGGALTGPIKVTVKGQTATGPDYTVYTPGVVSSISPVCGPVGTVMTISGSGFETNPNDTYVLFRGDGNLLVRAPVLQANSTQLLVDVPNGARTGQIVFIAFGTEDLTIQPNADRFTIATFTLTDFTPISGKSPQSVTIHGSGFSTTPANNSVLFTGFGNVPTVGTIVSSTDTEIVVTLPNDVTTGPIKVRVNDSAYVSFNNSFQLML